MIPLRRLLSLAFFPLLAIGAAALAQAQEAAPAQPAAPPETRAPPGSPPRPAPDDVKRAVYLPETVKAQLREEIKEEVLAQARQENWAAPNAIPEWMKRLKPYGDVRFRFERDIFARGNANTGEFPDFGAIDAGAPFDVNGVDLTNDRYLNVDQNRNRPRLRARLGVDADVGQGFAAGLRLASGESNSPVSTNQTLGGSGGDFSKYAFWLDRAFLRYGSFDDDAKGLAAEVGRFENPFFGTDLIWYEDLGFDGVAARARFAGTPRAFLTAGAFPLFTTAFNFPPDQTSKFASLGKWLFALQVGADWKLTEALSLKLGGAVYYFLRVEGRISSPCRTDLKGVSCDSDESRPSFAQKGNTYMAVRTPSEAALLAEASSLAPRYQYFGLASRFREAAVTARLGLEVSPQLRLGVEAEYVRNVGFSRKQIAPSDVAINNRGPTQAGGVLGPYLGGNTGYLGRLTLGSPAPTRRWGWSVGLAYRYLESDAVVDAFTDSDFGLGGTNLKGFIVRGTLALADDVSTGVRWMSADQISGPKYGVDVLQVDLSARF